MAVDTSRVLRIGVVWRSQVVAERVLDRRVDVTVGSRPDSTVNVISKDYPGFPSNVPVAIVHNGQYHVVLPSDPAHKLVLRGGPPGSEGVDKSQVKTVNGLRIFPIEVFTGGSVSMGDLIVMFQFVRGDAVPTVTREETVLRIGLVHEDRLLSDEIFHGAKPVTIGVGPTKTISLPDVDYKDAKGAPGPDATFTFDKNANKFRGKIPKESQFRLAIDGQPLVDNKDIAGKSGAIKQEGDFLVFDLPLKARGRCTMGPYTVLFQVIKQSVTVPTFARRSLLAKLASPFLADSTWTLSLLGAIVLVGSIVGQAMIFHKTTGRFLDKASAEEELAHTTFEVVIEEKEEPKEEDKPVVDIMSDKAKEETKKEIEKEKKPDKKQEKPESVGKTVDPEQKMRNAREAVVKNTVAGALVGANGAATKLFADGEGEGTVQAKFGGDGGGETAGGPGAGGLKIEGGGGGGGTMEKVKGKGGGFGERQSDVAKVDAPVKKEPVAAVKLSGLDGDDGGDGSGKGDIAKKIAGRAAAVKACYEAALRDNPDVSGKVKVSFTVGTAGTITDVTVSGAEGNFRDCIEGKFKSIRGLPILPAPKQFNQSFVFTKS